MKNKFCDLDLNTRELIRKSAIDLFAKFGVKGVSIRELAKASECNLAAISYYFGGKEKLYQECLHVLDEKFLTQVRGILILPKNKVEFEQRLSEFCLELSKYVTENSSAVRLIVNEINSIPPGIDIRKSFFGPILNLLESYIDGCKKNQIVRDELNAILMSRMLFSVIVNNALYGHIGQNLSASDFARDALAIFFRGPYE